MCYNTLEWLQISALPLQNLSLIIACQVFKGNDTYILAYKLNGEIFTYEIKSNECQVSGNGADSTKPDTFVVKSSNVKSPHIRIRKNVAENKFYVAAFAPTSIEEVQIPVSTPDEPKWVALNDGVNIDMNTFVVRFMKKH